MKLIISFAALAKLSSGFISGEGLCLAGLEFFVANCGESPDQLCDYTMETLCEMGCDEKFTDDVRGEWERLGGDCTPYRTLLGDGVPEDYDINKIMQYGCWCNFDDIDGKRLLLGQDKPVDAYDTICREYQQCMRCAKSDGNDYWMDAYGEPACDPHTEGYETTFEKPNTNVFKRSCDGNPTECSKSVCSCESRFLTQLFQQNMLSKFNVPGFTHEPMYQHKTSYRPDGTFIWEDECVRKPGSNPVCCGFYPYRAPHKETATKQCCGWSNDHIFNPQIEVCDDDNEQVLSKQTGQKTENDTTGKKESAVIELIKKMLMGMRR